MNNRQLATFAAFMIAAILFPGQASAYIGPGAGLSAIGTLVAVVGAFFLLVAGFIWYPVKRMLRKKSASPSSEGRDPSSQS